MLSTRIPTCPRVVGHRGVPFIPMNRMKTIKDGNGISTSSGIRFIATTWTLWLSAPEGEIASFTTIWWDKSTKTGAFEPVGTVPEHQRKGLAKALMTEGLKRLKQLGAVMAYVSSYGKAAHATYESVGFTEYDRSELWERTW